MIIQFFKYNGAGNDFILVDNRTKFFPKTNSKLIRHLCTRHFGIGADGLILLENADNYDFKMVYFNSDGLESSMCGNGGRCIIRFAHDLKIIDKECSFIAVDGTHHGKVIDHLISLQMRDVSMFKFENEDVVLDTGSPHYVKFVSEMPASDFVSQALLIRNREEFITDGINVNFAQISENKIEMRTFERGVEDETLACGTGATAVALAAHRKGLILGNEIELSVKGGELSVKFSEENGTYCSVWLTGPAEFVFLGNVHAL